MACVHYKTVSRILCNLTVSGNVNIELYNYSQCTCMPVCSSIHVQYKYCNTTFFHWDACLVGRI